MTGPVPHQPAGPAAAEGAKDAAPAAEAPVPEGGVLDRLLLVTTSPRLPAGLLSAAGWDALRSGPVYAADPGGDQAMAVTAAGIGVTRLVQADPRAAAFDFRERARGGVAVWLAGPDGDPGFARAVGDLVARA